MNKILVILGPTATGKSDLAVKLAKELDGEVISADSRQVYIGMDLGSGKITKEEMGNIPHHLLDVVSPIDTIYSVKDFQRDAYKAINEVLDKGKLPIVCGGTAFYIQSIVDGIVLPEIPANPELRKELESLDIKTLRERLEELDPNRYEEIDIDNPVRLIRAIEIAKALGSVPKLEKDLKYECVQIGLTLPEEELKEKISKRLDIRLEKGMLEEAKRLHQEGLSYKRMEALGLEYRYMAEYLQEKISLDEMKDLIKTKSYQFAKRQMTWFKKDERIEWFNPKETKLILNYIKK